MEKIKVYDGQDLFQDYEEWCHTLKNATDDLSAAISDISEFCKPLDKGLLSTILSNPIAYFDKVEFDSLKWIEKQRPVQREYFYDTVPKLIAEVKSAFNAWYKAYSERPLRGSRRPPFELCKLSHLEGLFAKEGFTTEWLEAQRPLFDEYLETPEELEFYQILKNLADATNKAAQYASHWQHKVNPVPYFLTRDDATGVFSPVLDGIKNYVTLNNPYPEREKESQIEIDPKLHAKNVLERAYFDLVGKMPDSDADLLALEIDPATEKAQKLTEYQELLKS